MAMSPEKKVKMTITKQLDSLGCYYFFPATGGYGSSGVPDIVGCYKGKFFGIECKAGKGKTTLLQDMHLSRIAIAGGIAEVVNEENMHDIVNILNGAASDPRQLVLDL